MRYEVLSGLELDETLIGAWDNLIKANPLFQSPYLSPWFTRTVAEVRDDVFVTVMMDGGTPVGFFPHQRNGRLGLPVAGRLNDCQAVIVDRRADWTPKDLLRGSRLKLWDFDHVLAEQKRFEPFASHSADSPVIELSAGSDAYFDERKSAGSGRVSQIRRKSRKLMREHGDRAAITFEPISDDQDALDQVMAWKIDKCLRTGLHPFFRDSWTVELVRRLLVLDHPGCSGALSVLRVGDEIAAAHFGMKSRDVWHWWFPVYSDDWSAYTPGGVLLVALCEHVADPAQRQSVIDLGRGDEPYKASFANSAYPLLEGHVASGSAHAYYLIRTAKRASFRWGRRSPLLKPVRQLHWQ